MRQKHATKSWGTSTSFDEVCRRAAGRRRYNAVRQLRADLRRAEVVRLAHGLGIGFSARGTCSRLAAQLGVHRSTVARDVRAILGSLATGQPCPACGQEVTRWRDDPQT